MCHQRLFFNSLSYCSVFTNHTQKSNCPRSQTFPCLFSSTFNTPKNFFFFNSLKSRGICQPQTELIALNHSRSLKVSDRGDVITGVAEVAWESSEILGLTSLQCCIQIRLINHPFTADFVNTGIDLGERFGPEM